LTPSGQPLTRLDKAIRRLKAQRTCLDWAVAEIAGVPGIVLELGLGNGRSFDHLRARLPGRDIYVFERNPQAHPASTPAADRLIVGNLEDTLPAARERFDGKAAFVHSDIGTGDDERNRRFAAWLGPHILPLLAPGAIVASDQALPALDHLRIAPPEGVGEDRYYLYRVRRSG
jgi:S-adenosyl-L-methionine methyltransferase